MKVLLYGRLADAIGREMEFDGPGCTAGELVQKLTTRFPMAAGTLGRSRLVAEGTAIGSDQRIADNEVVELLPPVSGG